ncbi:MAG: DegT/DnrJ/EryC1/StrS family aminotransferase [Gammaproteobacteria bacterium]|nr:DegT/DnrJ/EryC1/StrS family aminotransferase [Gammaproteobacteria bacterium]NIR85758.1 DegT/DnrJ/EryC1/StrS family aminotransferase [Gammaproteobacteria bacterium]NIR90291.1 DegT/DnrJ/EryC1/StrS family aminotransferase [Gammaproteobacteria bacterium]NIU06892.1 DegT/DnrJ/EryC1/StrS family aminotransferase [Gammaproteobacteria bacterium]NIV53825.1 aminotransferase DegT [Gammaproteobacteria bacterium]
MNRVASTEQPAAPVPPARVEFTPEDRAWIAERVQEVLASGRLTLGEFGERFEREFAAFTGARYAVAVSSGTAALEIIFRSLGIARKDVLVPTNTNFATPAAVIRAGGNPVLTDTDPSSLGTAPEEIERRLTPNTVGIALVHIGGLVSGRMPELEALARKKGLWIVEDAAHAHGSTLAGTAAGRFGVAGAFSFYPTKVMTSAEGGMIVTDDARIAEEARVYRDQGKADFTRNHHVRMGYNWRLSEPHAVIGLRHLRRLPEMLEARRRAAAFYDRAFADCRGFSPLPVPEGGLCNYYKYIVLPEAPIERASVKTKLREHHYVICAGEVYEEPIHRQPVFADYVTHELPAADELCARHLCLPMFAGITEEQLRRVVDAVRAVLEE